METDAVLNVILQMCLTPTPTLPRVNWRAKAHRLAPFSLWEKGWG